MSTYRGGWGGPSYRAYGGGSSWTFGPTLTPVVKKLLYLNVGAFLLLTVLRIFFRPYYVSAVYLLGVVPQETVFSLYLWQPVTYLFLHGGFWHLFFNMFALWMFGAPLERDWGGRRFLRYYFLTGIGAAVVNVAASLYGGGAAAVTPTVGASGAIYGILLAFGLLYPNQPIFIWFVLPVPARVFVLIFGALAFLSALEGPGSGVSHISHLGGMIFGLAYLRGGWLYYRARNAWNDWRRQRLRRKFEVYLRDHQEPDRDRPRPDRWIN
jgi:membrane associated rhomboid family serine protease